MRRVVLAGAALLAVYASSARAQQRICTPTSDSHETELLSAMAVPLAYATLEAPAPMAPGSIRVGLEGTYLPDIDSVTRTATQCRPGKGPEHTNLLFAFPRPRVFVGLPAGVVAEASWIPPVRLNGVKSNLVGLSLAWGHRVGTGGTRLTVRAHGTFGLIRAPITCPDEELQDPASECFHGTRSDDHYHPTTFGLETVLGWALGGDRVRPFVGAGVNLLRPRFQVNFTNQFGQLDDTKVIVNRTRGALLGGTTVALGPSFGISGEIYGAPGDEVTGRLMASYTLR